MDRPISDLEMRDLIDIQRLLDETYARYLARNGGQCRSYEGQILLEFNSVFDRRDGEPLQIRRVSIDAAVLNSMGQRWFDSTAQALAAVWQWHDQEMQKSFNLSQEEKSKDGQ